MAGVTRPELYDWWSRNTWALRGLYGLVFLGRGRTFRRRSVAALDLKPGDSVLELGCGPGNSFERLRSAVGPDGCVVGVDYSRGMVRRAAERVTEAGWDNVHVIRADATQPGIAEGAFDAAYAAMSLSAMPDPTAAVTAAAASLRPDGRLAVLDARPFQRAPLSLVNPVTNPVFEYLTDWRPEIDIPGAVDAAFEASSVDSYHFGSIYVATGVRPRPVG
ncbi:methyltransferase domain-containing protein [Halobellus sp. MBLA0160]|uniref:Methyltransferase domain-containing protein n=1 Tax=Halobellus ruber TaxID=2761102 RepID=A0A7J9SDC3_9EURY|nr:methyltransferase domain-containing protein [Halobellus ruber]